MLTALLLVVSQPLSFDDFSGVYRATSGRPDRIPVSAPCGWQPGADILKRTNWAGERDVLSMTMTGTRFDAQTLAFDYTGVFEHHHPIVPLKRVLGPGNMCVDYFDWFGCPDPKYTYAITGSVAATRDERTGEWGDVRQYLHFDLVDNATIFHGTNGTFNVRRVEGTSEPIYEFLTRWNVAGGSNNSADWPCIDGTTDPAWRPPTTGIAYYGGIRSGAAPLGGLTPLRGQLVDEAQTARTMSRARIAVYSQKQRLPNPVNQTLAEYEAAIRERLELVARASSGAEGRFVVPRVPLFRYEGDAATGHWQANLVTLVITGAEVDITGLSDAVPYTPRIVTNVPVFPDDGSSRTIGLTADISFGEKRTLISRLSRISKNYTPDEQIMGGHLDLIEGSPTPEQREGVRRAVWAERALLEGATSMRSVIKRFASVLGKVFASLWAELQFFKNKSVTKGLEERKRLNDARSSITPAQRAQFDLANTNARVADQAYSRRLTRASDSALASALKDVLKIFAHLVKQGALAAGISNDIANTVADFTLKILNFLLTAVIEQTVNGATQDFTKKFIEFATNVVVPVVFDNDSAAVPTPFGPAQFTVPFPLSYTNRTLDSVQFSVGQASNWSAADDTTYIADVTRSAQLTNAISESNVATLQRSYAFEGANKAADIAETAFAIAARIPGLQSLETGKFGAKGAKYLALLADVVNLEVAMLLMPSRVRVAVYAAYGLQPSMSNGIGEAPNGGPANTMLKTRFDAAQLEASAALTELDGLLVAHQIGTAADSYYLDDGRFRAAMRTLDRSVDHVRAQIRAGNFSSHGQAEVNLVLDTIRAADACAMKEAELDESMISLLLGTMESTWTSVDDMGYRSANNRVRAQLAALSRNLVTLDAKLTDTVQLLEVRNTLYLPAVVMDAVEVPVLDASPQTFTVRTRLVNIGVAAAPNVRAGLVVIGDPSGEIEILTSTTVVVGELSADDGAEGTGPDETTVEWMVRSTRPLDDRAPHFEIRLYEGNAEPSSFVADTRTFGLRTDPTILDADADGLPSTWETRYGLDPNVADADGDLDMDGVPNIDEFELGLDPSDSDTDGDGLSDGEETSAGSDGFRTNPFEVDSDFDGTNDNTDLSPLDASTTAAPTVSREEPVVDLSTVDVTLTPDMPVAVIDVRNTGGGELYFAAATPDTDILTVTPRAPGVAAPGTMLVLALPLNRDVSTLLPIDTTVVVTDVSGATRDFMTIAVHLRSEGGTPAPDGGVSSNDGGPQPPYEDGGVSSRDATVITTADGGSTTMNPKPEDGGCGCSAIDHDDRSATWFVFLFAAIALRRRSRRARETRGDGARWKRAGRA